MKVHANLEPLSEVKRRRIRYVQDQRRNVLAIWTLILGGCTMTYIAMAAMLKLYPLF
jgi:hypothetical protein